MSVFRTSLAGAVVAVGVASPTSVRLNNGVDMPLVSLGTAGYDDAAVKDAVILAADVGFKGVDTAFNYYNQVGVGQGLKEVNRSDIFVTSKTTPCWHPQAPPKYSIKDPEKCKAQTRADIEKDLSDLDVEYIDLLLLHGANHYQSGVCDDFACSLNVAQWQVYEEYYKAGKLRAIGVSNYCQSCLECLMKDAEVPPAVNQVQYHVGMTSDPRGVISYSIEHGIVPMAYSPMGSGMVFKDDLCTSIGQAHNKTAAQAALKWIVGKGYTLATKSNSRSHLEEDLDLFSWELSADEERQFDEYKASTDEPSWACTASIEMTV